MASAPANTRKNGRVPNAGPPGGGVEPTVGANANVPPPSTGVRLRKRKIIQNVNDDINIKMRERANARIAAAAAAEETVAEETAAPPANNNVAPPPANNNAAAPSANNNVAPAPSANNNVAPAPPANNNAAAPPANNNVAPTAEPAAETAAAAAAETGANPFNAFNSGAAITAPVVNYPSEATLKKMLKVDPVPVMFNVKNGQFKVSIPRATGIKGALEICSPSLKGIRDIITGDVNNPFPPESSMVGKLFGRKKVGGATRRRAAHKRRNTRRH